MAKICPLRIRVIPSTVFSVQFIFNFFFCVFFFFRRPCFVFRHPTALLRNVFLQPFSKYVWCCIVMSGCLVVCITTEISYREMKNYYRRSGKWYFNGNELLWRCWFVVADLCAMTLSAHLNTYERDYMPPSTCYKWQTITQMLINQFWVHNDIYLGIEQTFNANQSSVRKLKHQQYSPTNAIRMYACNNKTKSKIWK